MKRSGYYQGQFIPKFPEKYVGQKDKITYRSGWEQKLMNWCDMNPSVIKWNSEGIIIPYWSQADNKQRRYYVDFVVQLKTSSGEVKTLLIEVKPDSQTRPPKRGKNQKRYLDALHTYQVNQDKWAHADAWAKKNGMKFVVLNEYDLGIKPRTKQPAASKKGVKYGKID